MNKQERKELRKIKRQNNILKYGARLPKYTRGEEIFNAVTHIVGGAFGIIALIVGTYYSAVNLKDALSIISMIILGLSIIVLYTMSAIYHFLYINKGKLVFRVFDHCTIYFLIIGTYFPACFILLRNYFPLNLIIFLTVTILSILGIVFNAVMMGKKPVNILSQILYIICGWGIIIAYPQMEETIGLVNTLLIVFGGVSYTVGVIFFALGNKIRYFHPIWHIFDLIGTFLQFLGILLYIV